MNFLECVTLNPKVSLEKGKVYPFIEMGNVSTCSRNPNNIEYKSFDSGVKFEDGDTVIARITPCLQNGKRFYCKDIGKGFGSTEYLVFRPKDNRVDNLYLFYFMNTDFIKESMIKSMVGATGRQRVNNEVFSRLDVDFPDINTQHRIASVLSAYDDLIENNQRQIKLLEEAAQRLYKEWFVDLRFPGWEITPITDGVPEGWKTSDLSEIFDYVRGKSYTTGELSDTEGVVMVNLKNIQAFGGYSRNNEKRFVGKYKEEQCLSHGDVIMGVTDMTKERRLVGHVAMVPEFGEKAIMSMDLIKLVPKAIPSLFLYAVMHLGGYSYKISPLANGTNVLHLKPETMMNLEMLIPDSSLIQRFEGIYRPIVEKIEKLQIQCDLAAEARDRLLPKLMSGEIEL